MCNFQDCTNKPWKNGYCYQKHRKLANAAVPEIIEKENVCNDIVTDQTDMSPNNKIDIPSAPAAVDVVYLGDYDKSDGKINSSGLFEQIFDMETGGPRVANLRSIDEPFYEKFDHNKLAFILENLDEIKELYRSDARDSLSLDKYYEKSKDGNQGLGSLRVKYVQNYKNSIRGRYQARESLSGQNMVREVRHTIFNDYYVDTDMDNCHPVITVWMCSKLSIPCEFMAEYVANREKHIHDVICANPSLTRDDVKRLFLSINYGGKSIYKDVENKTPFLIAYNAESASIKRAICDAFKYFKAESDISRASRRAEYNLAGAAMSHICCFVENQLLMIIMDYLKEKVGDVSDSILCFDGIMIRREKFHESFMADLETIFAGSRLP
jgi:hypothetical protein